MEEFHRKFDDFICRHLMTMLIVMSVMMWAGFVYWLVKQ